MISKLFLAEFLDVDSNLFTKNWRKTHILYIFAPWHISYNSDVSFPIPNSTVSGKQSRQSLEDTIRKERVSAVDLRCMFCMASAASNDNFHILRNSIPLRNSYLCSVDNGVTGVWSCHAAKALWTLRIHSTSSELQTERHTFWGWNLHRLYKNIFQHILYSPIQ